MGLTNAPDIFMHIINNPLSDIYNSGMAVFLHNILTYSCTVKEHFTLLEKVLAYLHQYIFYSNLDKYSFKQNSKAFLGFNVTPKGMQFSNLTVQSLSKWPVTTMLK